VLSVVLSGLGILVGAGHVPVADSGRTTGHLSSLPAVRAGLAPAAASLPEASPSFAVTFTEAGIPSSRLSSAGWTVEMNGTVRHSTSAAVSFSVPNGTYPWFVTGPVNYEVAVTGPGVTTGQITVSGAASVSAQFTPATTVTLFFSERRLATGQSWCVALAGDEQCSRLQGQRYSNLTPGDYAYRVVSPLAGQTITASLGGVRIPEPGNLSVPNNETVVLRFEYPYAVSFTETGLPAGTNWSVTIQGLKDTAATGSPIVFGLPNGTYVYRTGAGPGETVSPAAGAVHVQGAARSVVTRSYAVTFTARGLPAGTLWSIIVLGAARTNRTVGTSGTIAFYEGNGTYSYGVGPVRGFLGVGSPPRRIAVSGGASVSVSFTERPAFRASLSARPPTVALGNSSLLTLAFVGGVLPRAWTLAVNGTGNANLSGVAHDEYVFTPRGIGTYTFYLNATDALGYRSNVTLVVTVPPVRAELTASASLIETGDDSILTVGVSFGGPPYAWTLQENGSAVNLATGTGSATYTFSSRFPGAYTFYLNATDSKGGVSRVTSDVTVIPHLQARLTATPTVTEVGQSSLLTIGLSQGRAPRYWTLQESGSPVDLTTGGVNGSYTFVPTRAGAFTFYLNASDLVGGTVSTTVVVSVEPALIANLATNLTATHVGVGATLTLNFTGGVRPLTNWTLTVNGSGNLSGASASGQGNFTYHFSPGGTGTYTFTLTATDKVGRVSRATVTITVT
jgi:hypothetical protein